MATITAHPRAVSAAFAVALLVFGSAPAALARPSTGSISDIAHIKPVPGRVLRGFSPPEKRWLSGHRGVDLAAAPGASVVASADGVVHFSGPIGGVTSVSILHADGIRTTYQPVETALKRGDRVLRGQVIGALVAHPKHPEPGLHWGALLGQDYLNPLDLLRRRPIVLKPVE
nr:M23 family metallopeptidase [Corynebacterium lactis]